MAAKAPFPLAGAVLTNGSRLIVLHHPVDGPFVLLLLYRLALVVFLLTTGQGDVHLGAAMLVDEHEERDDGEAGVLDLLLELAYLAFREEQFAVATRRMIGE